jgi:hypothetical protein
MGPRTAMPPRGARGMLPPFPAIRSGRGSPGSPASHRPYGRRRGGVGCATTSAPTARRPWRVPPGRRRLVRGRGPARQRVEVSHTVCSGSRRALGIDDPTPSPSRRKPRSNADATPWSPWAPRQPTARRSSPITATERPPSASPWFCRPKARTRARRRRTWPASPCHRRRPPFGTWGRAPGGAWGTSTASTNTRLSSATRAFGRGAGCPLPAGHRKGPEACAPLSTASTRPGRLVSPPDPGSHFALTKCEPLRAGTPAGPAGQAGEPYAGPRTVDGSRAPRRSTKACLPTPVRSLSSPWRSAA